MSGAGGSRTVLPARARQWAVTLALWWGGAQVPAITGDGQSLADVARAEAERRRTIVQPARLYTNKDLVPVAPPPPVAPDEHVEQVERGRAQGEATLTPPDSSRHGAGRDELIADEERWRRRLADAREALDRSRTIAEALQSRLNALTADFAARDDPAQRGAIAGDLQKTRTELGRAGADIDARQAAIAEIEEDARRAGVPPGWLR